ncbi:MAG: hypothetical protein OEZ48_00145 [Candidatus Bathyarchaeota archaeon]|nr:hypothetical protein [Candidatus Bathyarchaeota archaeon]MDH5686266.1 hypothetical protein [Candidatus Bathyarchaeota archaeon]
MAKYRLDNIVDYVWTAINRNYMIGILITSQAEARIKGEGWSFGAGKSTFALEFAKRYVFGGDWEMTKAHLISFVDELEPFLGPPRKPGIIIDDMQIDFGKHKSHDKTLQELAYFMTVTRPDMSVIIGTASHRNMLQKDFREELFHFEIIIPKRGMYEIQQLKRWIPFRDPLRQRERLEPFGYGPFLALRPEEQAWYDEWRAARNERAKARLKIFQKDGNKGDAPGWIEFQEFYRNRLGLRGDDHKLHQLYKYVKSGDVPTVLA